MQHINLKGRSPSPKKNQLRQTISSVLAGTTITLATMATANAAVIDDTVKTKISTGVTAVSTGNPSHFDGDLRDLKPAQNWQPGEAVKVANPRHIKDIQSILPAVNAVKAGEDPLLLKQLKASRGNKVNRNAVTQVNIDGIGFNGVNPPDTTGDIGLKYYIQSINGAGGSEVSIHDKTDGTKIAGPFTMASLHTGDCANSLGDPVVLFDEQAKRWLLTEFSTEDTKKLCVLVSKTQDPVTGGWYAYEFQAPVFPDYPKYSQIGGVYYASANEGVGALYAFEREKMLNGEPARMIRQEVPALSGFGFTSITPIDVDGDKMAPAGTPGMFIRHRDDELHNAGANNAEKDFLEIWTLQPDFANPENSTVEGPINIEISEFDSNFNCSGGGFGCLEQKGTTQTLDPLREVVMYKGQYRGFDGHESIVGNFITKVGDNTAAIRWFELRRSGDSPWTVHQEGTYSEADNNNRYMGAAAMDGDGNIAIAYMTTGKERYPSLAYNGRMAGDEAGILTFGEQTLVEGTGAIESDRDGDYSQMGVDPVDNCTMWFTAEYGGTGGQWGTRISSFKVPSCGDPNPGFTLSATNLTQEVCANGQLRPININASGYNEFNADIKLAYDNLPQGLSGSFSVDTFKPGVATVANVLVAEGTAAGSYEIKIQGSSDGAMTRSITSRLRLMDKKAESVLQQPANNATEVSMLPTLTWSNDGRATAYFIEIASDENFTDVVAQATIGGGNSYRPSSPLGQETTYYWRVKATNSCGDISTEVFKFATGSEKTGATALQKDVVSNKFTGEDDSTTFFYIDVPAGAQELTFNVSADNGDADLYVAKGIRPQPGAEIACSSETNTSVESCIIEGEAEGTYFAVVVGYAAYTDATITATFGGDVATGPKITGQKPLTTAEDVALAITPVDLTVEDPQYPTGYTLTLMAGENYTVEGNTITPAADFSGELTVKTKINNGTLDSEEFDLMVTVTAVNDAPVIGQSAAITIDEDASYQVQMSSITVTDVDNSYPTGFTMTLSTGENYTIEGSDTVKPAANFNGTLTVNVKVNDGQADSNASSLQLTVNPVNDEPVATNDTLTVIQDSTNNVIDVLANDTDVDQGDTLTLVSVEYSGTGSASVVEGKVNYSPKSGFSGAESISYIVKDSAGAQKTATVAVTVTATVKPKKSSGGSMALIFFLLPLIASRRFWKIS